MVQVNRHYPSLSRQADPGFGGGRRLYGPLLRSGLVRRTDQDAGRILAQQWPSRLSSAIRSSAIPQTAAAPLRKAPFMAQTTLVWLSASRWNGQLTREYPPSSSG